jgi:hypothetical protein
MTRRSSLSVLLLPLALTALTSGCKSDRPGAEPPPPTVSWEAPTGSSILRGSINVVVAATGATALSSLQILEPAALAASPAVLDAATRTGRITTTLDLSTFADGPLTLVASATDNGGRTSSQSITVTVAQTVPTITLVTPANTGAALSGNAVLLTVSASAANGSTITQLELVNPPAGVGANTSPSASLFTAVWNTTQALEGSTSLHFRATDSTGLVADQTFVVTVDNIALGSFDVRLSAGNPIAGATVTVYAIDDATGAVKTSAGVNGVLGSGGPTDAAGRVLITLAAENYTGPVRVVASGSSLQYADPGLSSPLTNISVPSSFTFSSFLASYATGSGVTIPLTLYTTLADHEALAVAAGRHPDHPGTRPLSEALAMRDQLFVSHITTNSTSWPLTGLRTTVPTQLNVGPRTLVDSVYAALFDVALNVLGHDIAARAGYSYSSTTINAITLTQLLQQDLDADGQFDGKGESGATLMTSGATPVTLDAQLLRVPLATALDTFIFDTSLNKTGLTRTDLTNAGVYDTISTDASDLFGAPPSGTFDNAGPSNTVAVVYTLAGGPTNAAPVGVQKFVAGALTITVDASDSSGVSSIAVTVNGTAVPAGAGSTATHFVGTWSSTGTSDAPLSIQVVSTDTRHNSTTTTTGVILDNTPPALIVTSPSSAAFYSTSVPLDVTAADAGAGVASLTSSGFTGLTDLDSAPGRLAAFWNTPPATADGVLNGQLSSCDLVGNCLLQPLPVTIDLTPPTITTVGTVPAYTNASTFTVSVNATDAGAGLKAVKVRVNGAASPEDLACDTASPPLCTLPLTLSAGTNTITVWAEDLAVNSAGAAPNSGDGKSAPYSRTYSILKDIDAPVPSRDTLVTSYYDERAMTLAGPTAPPVFQFPGGAVKVEPLTVGGVYKTSIRLGWSSAPTTAILESTNPDNIPWLRITCPTSSNTAPITSATYAVSLNGAAPVTGNLDSWKSSTSTATQLNYNLPISSNLFPALATTAGAVSADFTIQITDAAGNVGTLTFSTTIHVIGPPLWIEEDTSWTVASSFTLAGNGYGQLWSGTPKRLYRWIVSNPYSVDVGLTAPVSGTWTVSETIDNLKDNTFPAPTSTLYGADGGSCGVDPDTGAQYGCPSWAPPGGAFLYPNVYTFFWLGDAHGEPWHLHRAPSGNYYGPSTVWPCTTWPASATGAQRPRHRWNDLSNMWTALPSGEKCYAGSDSAYYLSNAVTNPIATPPALNTLMFRDPLPAGGEPYVPPSGAGYYTVAAATVYGPGQVVVYLERSGTYARDPELPLPAWYAAGGAYKSPFEIVYVPTSKGSAVDVNRRDLMIRTVKAATSTTAGTLQFNTIGRNGAAVVGEPSPVTITLNRTVTH